MNVNDWRRRAACVGADPEIFSAEQGMAAALARDICATCPVREACLDAALLEEKGYPATGRAGIRGGLDPKQRYQLTKKARAAAAEKRRRTGGKPPSPCGTPGAYDRHVRWGEPIDEACREAHAAKSRAQKAKTRARNKGPVVCGTRPGYQKHTRNGEKACAPCRAANTDADRRLRTTGSTLAPAA